MIFVSKDARKLIETLGGVKDWSLHFHAETLATKFSVSSLLGGLGTFTVDFNEKPPTMPDCPITDFRPYEDVYRYICMDFVTADYNRIDALRLAHLASHYPPQVIKSVAERCKSLEKFSLAYLASSLESEGSAEIDKLRREQKVDEIVADTEPLELPALRFPGKLSGSIELSDIDRAVDDILKRKPSI